MSITTLVLFLVPAGDCPSLARPVGGEVIRDFAPIGQFGGHWGLDFSAESDTPVRAADSGEVTFAGEVAGMLSVTVAHGGGLRTSYSYLSAVSVGKGERVERLDEIGRSGLDHGVEALHFSVRIGDRYQDPHRWLACFTAPYAGLRLIPVPHAYAADRATRHSRRNFRPSSSGTSLCRGGGLSRSGIGHRHVSPRRGSVAEGGSQGHVG